MGGRSDLTTCAPRTAAPVRLAASALLLGLLAIGRTAVAQPVQAATGAGVAAARPESVAVGSFRGNGSLPVLASRDLSVAQPDIVRAVITIHGRERDAAHYDGIARLALDRAGAAAAGTLLLTPRFADEGDPDLAPDALRWAGDGWMSGGLAEAPAAIGSFEALDAILAKLSDRAVFPALRTIVLVGHSGGGQLVQRYAVLGHMPPTLTARGVQVRFLVANPSSYSYFTADRPTASGGFAPFPLNQCHRFDDWKYGMRDLPDYADGATADTLERSYVQRDVTYLLGTADTDPDLSALDKSCAAEAQGATHLERGRDFFRYLRLRHPVGLNQYEYDIQGVGHDATAMLTSDCALATIYDAPLCGHVKPAAPAPVTQAEPAVPIRPAPPPPPPAKRNMARHTPPPPIPHRHPRERHVAPVRGWDWQPGNWEWNGDGYVWVPGHRIRRASAPMVFVPPSWRFDGAEWIWAPAHREPAG